MYKTVNVVKFRGISRKLLISWKDVYFVPVSRPHNREIGSALLLQSHFSSSFGALLQH